MESSEHIIKYLLFPTIKTQALENFIAIWRLKTCKKAPPMEDDLLLWSLKGIFMLIALNKLGASVGSVICGPQALWLKCIAKLNFNFK